MGNYATIGQRTPSFDGSDTSKLIEEFLSKGGVIQKFKTMAPATGLMRYKKNPTLAKDPDASKTEA